MERTRGKRSHGRETLITELKAWLIQMGVEPYTALSNMDWWEIAPIMDAHYNMSKGSGESDLTQNAPETEMPSNYKQIYNKHGQLTYAAVDTDGFFSDKPEYWVK